MDFMRFIYLKCGRHYKVPCALLGPGNLSVVKTKVPSPVKHTFISVLTLMCFQRHVMMLLSLGKVVPMLDPLRICMPPF